MVVVDTSVWIDYFRNENNAETLWLDTQLARQQIALTDLILWELLQGVENERQFNLVAAQLSRLHIFSSGGMDFAAIAAANYRMLRRRGLSVRGTVDCWIATFCILEGHSLLHRDRDFDVFETELGLLVVKP
jgi:predicted nucleic acid-binding protein